MTEDLLELTINQLHHILNNINGDNKEKLLNIKPKYINFNYIIKHRDDSVITSRKRNIIENNIPCHDEQNHTHSTTQVSVEQFITFTDTDNLFKRMERLKIYLTDEDK